MMIKSQASRQAVKMSEVNDRKNTTDGISQVTGWNLFESKSFSSIDLEREHGKRYRAI